ncbi:hypothetical protein Fmac_026989 [Flemingia macrophylla]|uniref:DRBM domain-containing protein n=1 Tax=Flemingia macrophylla TaxID=520843 RepID=A0ABD1LI40_9FABA
MYKTQLQELCHRRKWGLPKYSAVKDGPDHMPTFKASVYVHGATFTSSAAYTSLKQAHNQAAMHAFLNFSSGTSPLFLSRFSLFPWKVACFDAFFLMRILNNASKDNLDPPDFTCKTEDLLSASHCKATVIVNGQSSENPVFFNTVKEVQQAAAQLDLISLSTDILEKAVKTATTECVLLIQGGSDSFMASLLKLTKGEGFCKPTYKTMRVGSPHIPTFFCTVEIEGVKFHGMRGRTVQQAEEDAAKIAYIALKECGLKMYAAFSSSQLENKAVQSIQISDIIKCMQDLELEDELLDLHLSNTLHANVKVSNQDSCTPNVLLCFVWVLYVVDVLLFA